MKRWRKWALFLPTMRAAAWRIIEFSCLPAWTIVKFKRPVEPGDQLRMELTCLKRRGSFWKMQGVATVDGNLAAQAEISAMEIELPEVSVW